MFGRATEDFARSEFGLLVLESPWRERRYTTPSNPQPPYMISLFGVESGRVLPFFLVARRHWTVGVNSALRDSGWLVARASSRGDGYTVG